MTGFLKINPKSDILKKSAILEKFEFHEGYETLIIHLLSILVSSTLKKQFLFKIKSEKTLSIALT